MLNSEQTEANAVTQFLIFFSIQLLATKNIADTGYKEGQRE